jgi:hypothetical protein
MKDALFSKEGKEPEKKEKAEEQKRERLLSDVDGHGFY